MSASMWQGLVGRWAYKAGTSGTVAIPDGASIIAIHAHSTAGGTVSIYGGEAIPVVATFDLRLQFNHSLVAARGANKDVVFTTTTSYYIEYVTPGQP